MKKGFLFISLVLLTSMVRADITYSAYAAIKITSNGGADAKVRVYENALFSASEKDVDYGEAEINLNEGSAYNHTVKFYAPCPWGNAAEVCTNDIYGTKMTFNSNKIDAEYVITFTAVGGTAAKELYFQDNVTGRKKLIVKNDTMKFSQTINTLSEQRFEIVSNAAPTNFYTREVAAGNWGTICYPDSLTLIEGATVYAFAAINTAKTQVAAQEVAVTAMTPGKPYLFLASAAEQKFTYFPESAVAAELPNVALVGNFTQDTLALTAEKWVINNQQVIPAAVGSKVPKYRAYVDLEDPNLPVNDNQFTPVCASSMWALLID